MAADPVPKGYRTVTPYLVVKGAAAVIDFAKHAFGANERSRQPGPDGTIGHAEIEIGDSVVMIADATGDYVPMPGMLHVYLEDSDATYRRALEAGGTSLREPRTEFYGDRMAAVTDPAGNQWWIATRVEDLSPEEMRRRAEAAAAGGSAASER